MCLRAGRYSCFGFSSEQAANKNAVVTASFVYVKSHAAARSEPVAGSECWRLRSNCEAQTLLTVASNPLARLFYA